MDDAARVLQECAANPDDDAPRLVWADLVGGERGELVVIQCDLARNNLPPNEAAKRRARERELLEKYGVEWAGDVADIATRWAFRRGFIESVKLRSLAFDFSLLPPLVSTVVMANSGNVSSELLVEAARHAKLRGLGLTYPRFSTKELAEAPELAGLSALAVEHPTLEVIEPILAKRPITQLRLHQHHLQPVDVQAIVAAAPNIVSLDVSPGSAHSDEPFLAVYMRRPLRALRITMLGWKHLMYMAEHSAATLEHLAFPLAQEGPRTIGELAKYKALRTLDLSGEAYQIHAAIEALARTREGFEQLRVLKISEPLFPDELATLRARFANQLEVLEAPAVHEPRMLHEDFASSFTLAPACYERTPLVCVAQPGAKVWEFPPRPADEPIRIGRQGDNDITLFSSFVARRHAGLVWEGKHHVLRDFGSDNGTWIDGAMVRDGQRIADGTRFVIGNVPLVFFAGEGAKERAEQAVRA